MISNLNTVFEQMVKAQEKVGFDETQGIQQTLKDAIYIAETSASDLSWLTKDDAQALAISLATMRRHQAEFMHRRATEDLATPSWPRRRISTASWTRSSPPTS